MKKLFFGLALSAGIVITSCDQRNQNEGAEGDTAVMADNDRMAHPADDHPADIDELPAEWNTVDFDVAVIRVPEVTASDVEVAGTERFTIYGVDEMIMFDTDKATIRPGAEESLQQIATSLKQRYNEGNIRLYGFTDARASASYNKQLAEERAQSVKQWLVQNANIQENRISIHPVGETPPAAETPTGMQLNRRVLIVAMNPA